MSRATTFTAAQVNALVEQARQEAVKAAAEMHEELLAHLERVPANAIVLPLHPMTMHLASVAFGAINLESLDGSHSVCMYRYYGGAHAGSWLAAEKIQIANSPIWERSWGAMRPDDFGTLFEVRP
ncbi:hypothetical protein [Xylophilus ampelinus]|uniref:Uncharacterized protein n=1 Tax=Xylophilus ampelinus TaxID=54067 RepID=A0A318SQG1_9BURK|nr:hypothetical protein [Xylophilus ampelinus]MCS4509162.1 hypothetical protein [Xylophilus ampelinus]PYE79812.1 hypothetical protein DFQ15_101132 [Xylophilus ampelinus]